MLRILTFHNTTMDNINYLLYKFVFTLCYISIIPFTSIFHAVTMFTNHRRRFPLFIADCLIFTRRNDIKLYSIIYSIIIDLDKHNLIQKEMYIK